METSRTVRHLQTKSEAAQIARKIGGDALMRCLKCISLIELFVFISNFNQTLS